MLIRRHFLRSSCEVDVDVRCPVLVPLLLCPLNGSLWGAVNRISATGRYIGQQSLDRAEQRGIANGRSPVRIRVKTGTSERAR